MKIKMTFLVVLVLVVGTLWFGTEPAQAAPVLVDGPGLVLIVDGTDPDSGTGTFNIDATLPVAMYDFGFVNGGVYTPIALLPKGPASLYGTYDFMGGDVVDFALRHNSSGNLYTISDPADYADQLYFSPVDPSHSMNPVVTYTYYNTLVLEWDLNGNGFDPLQDAGFTLTQALNPHDGMAPVPIPASALLFGSGLLRFVVIRHITLIRV